MNKVIRCPECGKIIATRFPMHNCKPMLATDSPKYLKRLVRELNATPDGFYASYATFSVRCNGARLKRGTLEVRSPSVEGNWCEPSNHNFTDAYARAIVATRKP